MVAALLAGGQPEPRARKGVARPGSAQVDHGGQILLLLERALPPRCVPPAPGDSAIEQAAVSSMAWLGTTRV